MFFFLCVRKQREITKYTRLIQSLCSVHLYYDWFILPVFLVFCLSHSTFVFLAACDNFFQRSHAFVIDVLVLFCHACYFVFVDIMEIFFSFCISLINMYTFSPLALSPLDPFGLEEVKRKAKESVMQWPPRPWNLEPVENKTLGIRRGHSKREQCRQIL